MAPHNPTDEEADGDVPAAPRPLEPADRATVEQFHREGVEALLKVTGLAGTDADSLRESAKAAIKVVDALVSGLVGSVGAALSVDAPGGGSSGSTSGAATGPRLLATLPGPALARIATRSRLPLELAATGGTVEFRLSATPPPPSGSDYARLFGYAAGRNAELAVRIDGEPRLCGTLLPPPAHPPSAFEGRAAAFVAGNAYGLQEFKRSDVEGKLVIMKHDPRTAPSQEEKLLRLRQAGAAAAAFYIPGKAEPELACCSAAGLPAVPLLRKDGEALVAALQRGAVVECVGLAETPPEPAGPRLECGQPVPPGAVWLLISGLQVRRPASSRGAWAALQAAIPAEARSPERAFQWFLENRDQLFRLEDHLFHRVIESVYSRGLVRRAITLNGWGEYFLQMITPANDREIRGLRFEICKECSSGVGVSGAVFPAGGDAEAHALFYAHVLDTCRTLLNAEAVSTMKKQSPSAEAWARVTCSQFANCPPADAAVVTKLLSPCTGPVGPAPSEAWQRADPMWNIVDSTLPPRKQGRLWWRLDLEMRPKMSNSMGDHLSTHFSEVRSQYDSDWQDAQSQLNEVRNEFDELWSEDGGSTRFFRRWWHGATVGTSTVLQSTSMALKATVQPRWRRAVHMGLTMYDYRALPWEAVTRFVSRCTCIEVCTGRPWKQPLSPRAAKKARRRVVISTAAEHIREDPEAADAGPSTSGAAASTATGASIKPRAGRALTAGERGTLERFNEAALEEVLDPGADDSSDLRVDAEAALEVVRAIVSGIVGSSTAALSADLGPSPRLTLSSPCTSVALIATRSRLPFELVATACVEFRLSRVPPPGMPSHTRAQSRLFGYAAGSNGELRCSVAGEPRTFPTILPPPAHDLSTFQGVQVAYVPGNDFGLNAFRRADVAGRVVLMKHDQRTAPSQDEKLLHAKSAGAVGAIFFPTQDVEPELGCCTAAILPAVHIHRKDGEELVHFLREAKAVESLSLTEVDLDVRLECGQPVPNSAVWLHISGLQVRRPATSRLAWAELQAAVPADERSPERVFQWFLDCRHTMFPLATTLFHRVLETVYSRVLLRSAISLSAWGEHLLQMISPSCDQEIRGLRFEPCDACVSGVGVSGALFPVGGDTEAHAFYYGYVMDSCRTLLSPDVVGILKRTSPSAEAWARLTCSQYANCAPADAVVVTKLLSPCRGPVGPEPTEEWQRADPMWNIVDEPHPRAGRPRWQGRLWWRPEGLARKRTAEASLASLGEAFERTQVPASSEVWAQVEELWFDADDGSPCARR